MNKIIFLAVLSSSLSAFAGNGQCALCQINRDNNAKQPSPPAYYEDYLESQKKGSAPAAAPAAGSAEVKTAPAAPAPSTSK